MPINGFKTITVSDETYGKLEKAAQEHKRSIPQEVSYLVELKNQKQEVVLVE